MTRSGKRAAAACALLLLSAFPSARAGEADKGDEGPRAEDIAADARKRFVGVRLKLQKSEGDYPDGDGVGEFTLRERKP
ncbi:MAG: hypothetical protein ACYS9X_29920, partial [Planctomycetota bacterium]